LVIVFSLPNPPLTNPVTLPAGSVNKAMAKSPISVTGMTTLAPRRSALSR
jgi:hypothetical protein